MAQFSARRTTGSASFWAFSTPPTYIDEVRSSWTFGLLLLVLGCGSGDRAPHLIELQGLEPRHLEVGDRMRVTGSGFPEGRPATVTLRGEVRRAGEVPRASVTLTSDAEQVAPHALELPISAELAGKLCGAPSARHATFRGDVEVSFSPQTASGLPVIGRLDGVVIDFVPSTRDDNDLVALRGDGARFARFLGIGLNAAADGLQVTSVEPQGRAARGNLAVGDVISELDGVVVRGIADFIPPPNAKSSQVLLRRGPDSLALRVDSSGFRYSAPETLLPTLFVFGVLLGSFALILSPLGRWFTLFERRLGERLQRSTGAPPRARSVQVLRSLLAEQLPESVLPYLALVGASLLFSLLALFRSVIWLELDVVLVPAVTLSGLFVSAFIAGDGGSWKLGAGLSRALTILLFNVPLVLFIGVTAWWAGSLRVSDVVALQGPWPWQWAVFQNPVLGVLALMALASQVSSARDTQPSTSPERPRQRALALAAFVHMLGVTGLIALLGLGGPELPLARTSGWTLGAGVVLTLTKASLLVGCVALLRWIFGSTDVVRARRGALGWLVLPSATGVGLMAMFTAIGPGPLSGTLRQALPASFFGSCLVAAAWIFGRVARAARGPSAQLRIQSWL
jgi:hypothetical protein